MAEELETINQSLRDNFGIDTVTGLAIHRVVWSTGMTEKRKMNVTDAGIQLLTPEVREVLKYPYDQDFYILERLSVVPEVNRKDLPDAKISYEPLWVFRDANGFPIQPTYKACQFLLDILFAALGKKSAKKYTSEEEKAGAISSKEEMYELNKAKIDQIQTELFGNESGLHQATFTGQGIVVPSNYGAKEN